MVVGFDKFKEYFESFRDEFIIIGGTAVQMVCGERAAEVLRRGSIRENGSSSLPHGRFRAGRKRRG
jgi:hypothetical protein